MEKFKVGDKVRIINKRGCTWNGEGEMDKWMGKIMTIRSADRNGTYMMIEDINENYGGWSWRESDFAEKITPQSIHITTNGNTVHAILKDGKTIKRSKAVCAPSDTFDFEVGARLAVDRLFASEVKEVKRAAKVGEWVKIFDANATDNCYKNGDILKVISVNDIGGADVDTKKRHANNIARGVMGSYITEREYIVLENYQPEPEHPKKKRIFSTVKFIEEHGAVGYMESKLWVDKCEGKEVVNGQCNGWTIDDSWTIEI